jgi:hypothetical protein
MVRPWFLEYKLYLNKEWIKSKWIKICDVRNIISEWGNQVIK